jgi:chemotaxis protein CheX
MLTKEPNIDQARLTGLLGASAEMVFSVMLQDHAAPKTPPSSGDGEVLHDGIISFIGLAGDWSGTGSVICSGGAALAIASRLLLIDAQAVDQEVLDAVGEITNMIFGNFKDCVESYFGLLSLSTPSVIYGRHVRARDLPSALTAVAAVEYRGEPIELKVCLSPARKATSGLGGGVLVSSRYTGLR